MRGSTTRGKEVERIVFGVERGLHGRADGYSKRDECSVIQPDVSKEKVRMLALTPSLSSRID